MSTIDAQRINESTERPRVGQHIFIAVSELFGRKWHALILFHLHNDSMTFTGIKREIDGISGKMLAESLESLTDDYGVVERREVSDGTNRVEYSLSAAGEALTPMLLALHDWGTEHLHPEAHE